ncbi:hypothetical protein PRIPAC_76693 [Pristionchus pacificus]|uniref:Uncharacterized protein n=1 Tax=Pristionchus pacificus TaxID=54126 RepID=A0A2A6C8W4_PRIPA|nr:hypothetical protein PRIPAC_76693 [Pristionchus pacificus]|eukprot:PDM74655.1 hypothetical protein PRIPAC_42011 [Pristionchus pacificus]
MVIGAMCFGFFVAAMIAAAVLLREGYSHHSERNYSMLFDADSRQTVVTDQFRKRDGERICKGMDDDSRGFRWHHAFAVPCFIFWLILLVLALVSIIFIVIEILHSTLNMHDNFTASGNAIEELSTDR